MPRRAMRCLSFAAALCVVSAVGAPGVARAAGAWRSYMRPSAFYAMIADRDTIWCATQDAGLLRFTPSRHAFSSVLHEPNALSSNRLSDLALDRTGRLWVGTAGNGASVRSVDGATWTTVNAFDGLPSDSVTTLTAQGDSMWIGTTRGFAVWDGTQISGRLPDGVNPSPFASDNITGIALRGDTAWVATSAGVYHSLESEGLITWTRASVGLVSSAVDELVDDGASLFALSFGGVYRFDAPTTTWVRTTGIGTAFTLRLSRGAVLAGTGTGLFRWSGAAWTSLNATLRASAVSPLIVALDPTGRAWAAGRPTSATTAAGNGLYAQPAGGGAGAWTFESPPGPPGNSCVNLDLEGDRVYVTTLTTGIGRLQGETWKNWFATVAPTTTDTTFRSPRFTYCMLIDKSSHKWFLSWAPYFSPGAVCVPDTGAIEVMTDSANVIHIRHIQLGPTPADARLTFGVASTIDSLGGRWFGLSSPCGEQPNLLPAGLEYFADPNDRVHNYTTPVIDLPSTTVQALVTDQNRRVWVGTALGLSYFSPDTFATQAPPDTAPALHRLKGTDQFVVRALATRHDTLWVLTPSRLYQYSINATNPRFYYDVPLASVLSIRPMAIGRDGTLWLGTSNGVSAFHPGVSAPEQFTVDNSPLADNDVRSIRVDPGTGVVWIATASGLTRYDPSFVESTVKLPSLTLSAFPNPARLTALGTTVRLSGNGAGYDGRIFDLQGRRVGSFSVIGNGQAVWDGRGPGGDPVQPGIYFLRAESGGRSAVVRLVLLR